MTRLPLQIAMVLTMLLCGRAVAGTSLSVQVGWEGVHRPARWGPLFVTISDTTPRAVTLDVYAPHGGGFTMLVRQHVSASPTEATYPIYLPLHWNMSDMLIVARDAQTQRWLAEWPEFDQRSNLVTRGWGAETLIATSGRGPALRGLGGTSSSRQLNVVHVPPIRLPIVPQGYDSFDLLVLNQPDLNRMSFEQQQAIADWVRAGGALLLWPGEDPWPAATPVTALMPCTFGENILLEIDPEEVESAGLSERFGKMKARQLSPHPGAQTVPMFNTPAAAAWRWDVGFGQVLVIPFDASQLVFKDDESMMKFHRPLLISALGEDLFDESNRNRSWQGQQRRSGAFTRATDMLGDVPGVGKFGFGYVAAALIAMMIVVGPVDWFLLRYLGRQPWTWFTTAGWIGLVTMGAIFVGFIFRSGDLHFRTLRIIDQAGNVTVATHDLVCIYAPRTRLYEINVDRESWWQPGADLYSGRSGPLRTDVPFAQDTRGTRPQPMRINVWNLRFLEGESLMPGPPAIEAALNAPSSDPFDPSLERRVSGTITNRGSLPLRNIAVKVGNLTLQIDAPPLMPGQSLPVAGRAVPLLPPDQTAEHFELWALNGDRSGRIETLLASRADLACVYAEVVEPQPAVTIASPEAKEKHWQIIRALVPVSTESR